MNRAPIRTLLAAAVAVCISACPSGTDTPETTEEVSVDESTISSALDAQVNEEYGALGEDDEAPAFGEEGFEEDATLAGDSEPVEDVVDNAEDNDLLEEIEAEEQQAAEEPDGPAIRPRRVTLAVLWGHLRGPEIPETPTDWSGSLSIENGALRVLRSVAFDPNDEVIRPRPDLRTVEFNSQTRPHLDGMIVQAILHPRLGTGVDGPAVITLDTPAFTGSLTLRPDMAGSRFVPVGEGNAVAYHVFRPGADGCENGLLGGRWIEEEVSEDGRILGKMRGHYLSSSGQVRGHLRGVYGQRVNGTKVFFAKVINHDGDFTGVLAGKYRNGRFRGRYLGQGRTVEGVAHGHYRAAPSGEQGAFRGRWSQRCGEAPNEGSVEPHDEYNDEVDAAIDELEDMGAEVDEGAGSDPSDVE